MSATSVTCPHCGRRGRLSEGRPVPQVIRCPACKETFRPASADVASPTSIVPARPEGVPRVDAPPAPPPVVLDARVVERLPEPARPAGVPSRLCDFCGEAIQPTAKKCRHCGELLDPALRAAEEARRLASRPSREAPPGAAAAPTIVVHNTTISESVSSAAAIIRERPRSGCSGWESATMATSRPRRITEGDVERTRKALSVTAKTLDDGSPNPNHAELAEKLAAAEARYAAWGEFEEWANDLGYFVNRYPAYKGGQTFDPGRAFYRKRDRSVLSFDEAWALRQAGDEPEPAPVARRLTEEEAREKGKSGPVEWWAPTVGGDVAAKSAVSRWETPGVVASVGFFRRWEDGVWEAHWKWKDGVIRLKLETLRDVFPGRIRELRQFSPTVEEGLIFECRTFFFDLPWRSYDEPLSAEEVAEVERILAERLGTYVGGR